MIGIFFFCFLAALVGGYSLGLSVGDRRRVRDLDANNVAHDHQRVRLGNIFKHLETVAQSIEAHRKVVTGDLRSGPAVLSAVRQMILEVMKL